MLRARSTEAGRLPQLYLDTRVRQTWAFMVTGDHAVDRTVKWQTPSRRTVRTGRGAES